MSDANPPSEILQAVGQYLIRQGLYRTSDCLQEESGLVEPIDSDGNVLEARWTEVERLRSRVNKLELLLASEEKTRSPLRTAVKRTLSQELRQPRLQCEAECAGHKEAVMAVALHASEPVFASGSADCFVRIFDYELQSRLALLRGHTQSVNCVSWAGNILVSASSDLSLRIWQSNNKSNALAFGDFACLRTLIGHEHAVSCIVNVPESDLTLSCSRDTTLRLWDRTTGACRKTVRAHSEWVRCLDINDEHVVSAGNDKRLFVFDLQRFVQHESADTTPLNSFDAHENYIEAVKLQRTRSAASDERVAFTAARDKTARMWNYLRGQLLRIFTGHDNWVLALTLVGNGAFLVSAGEDRTLRIWDVNRGEQAHMQADTHRGFIYALDSRNAENLVVTGGADRYVRVWRIFNAPNEDDNQQ